MTQKGFTLVELAIALMVIGLLIGGVLKGQELIENAKITSVIRQVKAYDAAALIFRNTYGALPGDIKRPNRIPNCTAALCTTAGNGNGQIAFQDTSSPAGAETYNFFPHLTKASMIQGPEGGTVAPISENDNDLIFPTTALDLYIGTAHEDYFRNGNLLEDGVQYNHYQLPVMYTYNPSGTPIMPVRTMVQIDTKLDDGKPHSGDVQIYAYGDCPSIGYLAGNDENEYAPDDTSNVGGCPLAIRAGF